jgi:hypothetical protein
MSLFDWGDSKSTKGTEEESFFPGMGTEASIASTVIGAGRAFS